MTWDDVLYISAIVSVWWYFTHMITTNGKPLFELTSYGWIRDHPQWREKHPHGPVTFDLLCPKCNKVIIEDGNLDDFKTALQIHAKEIH